MSTRLLQFKKIDLAHETVGGLSIMEMISNNPLDYAIVPSYDGVSTLVQVVPIGQSATLTTNGGTYQGEEIPTIHVSGDDTPLGIRLFGAWPKPAGVK